MSNDLSKFKSVTVFVLTYNDTILLRKTVSEIIKCDCFSDIHKIIIVVKNDICDGFFEAAKIVDEDCTGKVSIYLQKSPTIELCISELPPMVDTSHFIIMASDMEMNPADISDFVRISKENPEMIICAAKWLKGSTIEGYGRFHELGSRMMNTFVSILFNQNVKDPFSVYQIYPLTVYEKLKFNKPSEFVYEYTLKAIHNKVEYKEIPTVYRKRTEGKSLVNVGKMLKTAMLFCFTAIRVRFSHRLSDDDSKNIDRVIK